MFPCCIFGTKNLIDVSVLINLNFHHMFYLDPFWFSAFHIVLFHYADLRTPSGMSPHPDQILFDHLLYIGEGGRATWICFE